MKKVLSIIFVCLVAVNATLGQELASVLSNIKGVKNIEKLDNGLFKERYLLWFEQPVNHEDPSKGTFVQRVILSHEGFDSPTLIVTEGYDGNRAFKTNYREEISKQLKTNQIFVEHRFFGKSVPDSMDWSEMTGKNAAADLHAIKQAMSAIYTKKWVASGISKGGQNTMIYATYFPNDVDAYVPYVGPVCKAIEDGRHEPFINSVGRKGERDSIMAFQKLILSKRDVMLPMFTDFCKKNDLKFKADIEEIYDLCVLEYSFTMWQWGNPVTTIPNLQSPDTTLFNYFVDVAGPDYFMVDRNSPFFVQASAELGYYGYDIRPFRGLLSIKTTKNYLRRIVVPEDALYLKFSKRLSKDILSYLKHNDPKMLFIYGEIDPWSSVMPSPRLAEGKQNMKFYIQPRGSHRTRINTQSEATREEIWNKLREWLEL